MNAPFQFTPQATEDLDGIWWFIAEDNRDAAGRVEMEIVATCRRLAKHPHEGSGNSARASDGFHGTTLKIHFLRVLGASAPRR